jgi:hypothetical protein
MIKNWDFACGVILIAPRLEKPVLWIRGITVIVLCCPKKPGLRLFFHYLVQQLNAFVII